MDSSPSSVQKDLPFSWDDFCAYIFGAAEPISPPKAPAPPVK
jgi:hypothetical protein